MSTSSNLSTRHTLIKHARGIKRGQQNPDSLLQFYLPAAVRNSPPAEAFILLFVMLCLAKQFYRGQISEGGGRNFTSANQK